MEPNTSPAPPAQSTDQRMDIPGRESARRQNAAAYLAWEAKVRPDGLDDLDRATARMSLTGAEW